MSRLANKNTQTVSSLPVVNGKRREFVMVQAGKIEEMNREFDVAFWQAQSTSARFQAGWELVEEYHTRKGLSQDELRLQRTVATLQRL